MVRSESAMTNKDANFLKATSSLRLVKEGIESLVIEGSDEFSEDIIDQARKEAGLYGKEICGQCTTHNAVPCKSGNGHCHYDKDNNCRFHDKNDPLMASTSCPNGICDRIVRIIKNRHRFHSPNFKITDARKWFQNQYEIMKCFIPTDGYEGIETVEGTDCTGLLSVIINCKSFQSKVAADLGTPDNIFVKMREVRNKIFHSANFDISDRELQSYLTHMLLTLNDKKFLAHDEDAQTAAEKIKEIADSSVHVFCGEEVDDQSPEFYEQKENVRESISILRVLRERWDLEVRKVKIINYYDEAFFERESSDGRKVLEPVFKSTTDQQKENETSLNNNVESEGTQNKPKGSIVIVFAVKKKQANNKKCVSTQTSGEISSGEFNKQSDSVGTFET